MKLNIFKIPFNRIDEIKTKLIDVGHSSLFKQHINGWNTEMFFSNDPDDIEIPWLKYFKSETNVVIVKNKIYYGVFLWYKEEGCFAVTFGKSHHYAKQFCEKGFGLNIATRVADQTDIRQKSVRKFGGRNIKAINSYQKNTLLNLDVNESVDFLSAKISQKHSNIFGKQAKFGDSLLITKDINWNQFSELLNNILSNLSISPEFKLPQIIQIKDEAIIRAKFEELNNIIINNSFDIDIAEDSYSIVGVDFNFNSADRYEIYYKKESKEVLLLELHSIVDFSRQHNINLFDIKIKFITDNRRAYSKKLEEVIEFTHPTEQVILQEGKWYYFNEEFMEQLNEFVDKVYINTTNEFHEVARIHEGKFNEILAQEHGYQLFDKKLGVIEGHTFEICDLIKDNTAYAVKFGNTQKLGYVFDQAMNTISLLISKVHSTNNLSLQDLNINNFCIWLIFYNKNKFDKLSSIKSLIFKQKLVAWNNLCKNLGINNELKISYVKL